MKTTLLITISILAGALVTAQADDIKEIYSKECAKCHGDDGKGDTKMGKKLGVKDYTDAKVQAELKDDKAMKSLKEGIKDDSGKTLKKPFESLTDDQIKGLIKLMRQFKK